MATVSRENIGYLNDKVIVTITKEDYLPNYEKGLKQYAKQANIPGFRKGMVPAGVIKKMYGQSLFMDGVMKVMEKELTDYITNEKLQLIGTAIPYGSEEQPRMDHNNPTDYTFTFEIGIQPEVAVDLSKGKFTRYKITIPEEFVDNDIEEARRKFGKYSEPETVTDVNNFVSLSINYSDAEGNVTDTTELKPLNLDVKYFSEAYQKQLMGKKAEDTLVLRANEAFGAKEEDYIFKELGIDKANDVYFKATVSRIGNQEPAEMNEEFFNKVFPGKEIKTEEEFKAAVKEAIGNNLDDQSRYQLQDQIYHHLADHTEVAFPDEFLKRYIKLNEEEKNTAEEDFDAKYKSYQKEMRYSSIINTLADEYKVTVEKDDYINHAKQQLMSYMQNYNLTDNGENSWVDSYAENMLKDKKFVEKSYYEIRVAKVYNALDKVVKTTEEAIDFETFKTKLHHHHH